MTASSELRGSWDEGLLGQFPVIRKVPCPRVCSSFFYKNWAGLRRICGCFLPGAGLWGQVYLPRCHVPSPWSIFRRKLCQSNASEKSSGVVMVMPAVLIPAELVNVTGPSISGLELSTEQISKHNNLGRPVKTSVAWSSAQNRPKLIRFGQAR